MPTPEQQPTSLDPSPLESEFSLTKQELDQFRKLPKTEQEKQKKEMLVRLQQRQEALEQAIQEAIQTGKSDEVKRLVDQQQREVSDLESLLGGDPEALRTEFTSFLRETWKIWGVDEEKIKNAQIRAEIITPSDEDYASRKADIDEEKFGQFTLNPDTQGLDWETLKDKIFIPDPKEFEDCSTVQAVAERLIEKYSHKYKLPGLEYWKFMLENPDKVPDQLKDGNYYFNFGSLVRSSVGSWGVPYAGWDGSKWYRDAYWLDGDWDSPGRVVLLEI